MTRAEQLLRAVDSLDDEMLHEAVTYRPTPYRKWIAVAACLCVVALGAFFVLRSPKAAPVTEAEMPAPAAPATIYDGRTETFEAEACYVTPENGMIVKTVGVGQVLETAGENDRLFVRIQIWQDGRPLDPDSEEFLAEAKRLASLGYEVGWYNAWTYDLDANKVDDPFLYGIFFTPELRDFPENENFGYFFCFPTNGDGTPVIYEGIGDVITAENEPLPEHCSTIISYEEAMAAAGLSLPQEAPTGYSFDQAWIDAYDPSMLTAQWTNVKYVEAVRADCIMMLRWTVRSYEPGKEIEDHPIFGIDSLTLADLEDIRYDLPDDNFKDYRLSFHVILGDQLITVDCCTDDPDELTPEWFYEQLITIRENLDQTEEPSIE